MSSPNASPRMKSYSSNTFTYLLRLHRGFSSSSSLCKELEAQPLRGICSYHSRADSSSSPFQPASSDILSAALLHVPNAGFTPVSLSNGARDAGYPEVSTNLFPRGPFDLVNYHLVTQRLALRNLGPCQHGAVGIGSRVRALMLRRLRGNRLIVHRWQEALAIMAQPSHVPSSLYELFLLSDEIWHLAGDTSVDSSWYTKRASLSAIYASTELFMTTDTSREFLQTERFLDRRLEGLQVIGQNLGSVSQWLDFSTRAANNVLRSKGIRL